MDDIIGADTATATDAGCLDDETTTGNKYIGAGPGGRAARAAVAGINPA